MTYLRPRRWLRLSELSFGVRWFLASSILLLVAVLPFGIYQARSIQKHLETQVRAQLVIRATAARDQVAQFLGLQRHVVWSLGRLLAQELERGEQGRVPALLRETHEHEANLSALFLLDALGTVLFADPPMRFNGEPVRGLSYADRDYFHSAMAGRGVSVGNVVMGRTTGTPTLGFAYALRDAEGEVRNVLTAGFDLAHFQRWLDSQLEDTDIQVLVLDERHHVIAKRVPDLLPTNTDTSDVALYHETNYTGLGVDHTGQEVFAVVSSIEDLRWRIVVMAPTSRVGRAVAKTIRETASVGVGAILGAMLLSVVVARSLSRPIHQLIEGFNAVAQGDQEHAIEVRAGPEFRQMAAAFNQMTRAVTERNKQLEDAKRVLQTALSQAEEANRHKSEFVANVSHELRTPLNAIVNIPTSLLLEYATIPAVRCLSCEALEAAGAQSCKHCGGSAMESDTEVVFAGSAAEHRHFLTRLEQSSQHLLRVVNDLLDFSKIEAGYMELCCQPVDVAELVDTVLESMASVATDRQIALESQLEAPEQPLEADALRLRQVLLNLVSNALKFTEPRGTVITRARNAVRDGRPGMRFEVEDTGMGIPQDKLELVFEAFRQVDGSHTRRRGGTGLGLAISKRLVELHGGSIGVESAVGVGTKFWFWLPLAPARPQARDVAEAS